MNGTSIEHGIIAVVLQGLVMLVCCLAGWPPHQGAIAGALLGIGVFAGREVTQAEKKPITRWSWLPACNVFAWSRDGRWDLAIPALFCLAVVGLAYGVGLWQPSPQ